MVHHFYDTKYFQTVHRLCNLYSLSHSIVRLLRFLLRIFSTNKLLFQMSQKLLILHVHDATFSRNVISFSPFYEKRKEKNMTTARQLMHKEIIAPQSNYTHKVVCFFRTIHFSCQPTPTSSSFCFYLQHQIYGILQNSDAEKSFGKVS